jgi:hypothetical protein
MFDLRDLEFRTFFLNRIINSWVSRNHQDIIRKLLDKEELSDGDLIIFYLEFDKMLSNSSTLRFLFVETLFDYKMDKIESHRIFKFSEIVKNECLFFKGPGRISYLKLRNVIGHDILFDKLADIFLDHI